MAPSMKVSGKMTSSMGKVKLTGPIAAATSATTMKVDVTRENLLSLKGVKLSTLSQRTRMTLIMN